MLSGDFWCDTSRGLSPDESSIFLGESGRQCAYCKARASLFSRHIIPGPEAALNACPILCGLRRLQIEQNTLPQPIRARTFRSSIRPLKDAAAVNATRYAIGVQPDFVFTDIVLVRLAGQSSIASAVHPKPTGLTQPVSVSRQQVSCSEDAGFAG